jgi:hypothetical protein
MNQRDSSADAHFLGVSAVFLHFRRGGVCDSADRHRIPESPLHLANAAKTLSRLRRVASKLRRLLPALREKTLKKEKVKRKKEKVRKCRLHFFLFPFSF